MMAGNPSKMDNNGELLTLCCGCCLCWTYRTVRGVTVMLELMLELMLMLL
jgi:hypothetical protein